MIQRNSPFGSTHRRKSSDPLPDSTEPGAADRGFAGQGGRYRLARVFTVAAMAVALGGVAWAAPAAYPPPPLPPTALFDLSRQSDLVVLATALGGDTVKIDEVLGQKNALPQLTVANFERLRRGLFLAAPPTAQEQAANQAILFLRSYNKHWWILETIPRSRAANGCLWVRDTKVFWYSRNPGIGAPQLVERPLVSPPVARKAAVAPRKSAKSAVTAPSTQNATLPEVLDTLRLWQSDLARLRAIDRMTSPLVQLRALRAFIVPSTRSPHSPEVLAQAVPIYREVAQQVDAIRDGKKPEPVANSAWLAIRPAPSPAVLQSVAKTKSDRASERLAGLQELASVAAPEAISAALRSLGDTSTTVRLSAARALGDFADASCSTTLLRRYRATRDPADPLRPSLVRALATTEESSCVAELILALQEPDEPLRPEIGQQMIWLSGYGPTKETGASGSYLTAQFWAKWYEKRYAQKLALKLWDFARLEGWIKRRAGAPLVLSASDWSLVSASTIAEILNRCGDLALPYRQRWCEMLLQAWGAGVLTREQQQSVLDTFGRATLAGRTVYPLGSSAMLRVSSAWPVSLNLPDTLRFLSRSQVYVDGSAVGRSYPIATPSVYVSGLSPGDYGPGKHRLSIETEYTVRVVRGTATSQTVKTPEMEFHVALPNENIDLQAKTDPTLDAQVERAFRFIAGPDTPTTGAGTLIAASLFRRAGRVPPRAPRRLVPQSSGGYLEVFSNNHWELTEKLPVDLAFDVEYEFPDYDTVVVGVPLYVPAETTTTAELVPYLYRARGLEKPGTYRFVVHLTPSRDVALSQPNSRAYWDGFILTSPQMTFRVAEVPKAPKK